MTFELERFKKAHDFAYSAALDEIRNGKKMTHWIWYIFPQLKGLGYSVNAQYYGIRSIDEAKAYMEDKELKDHLIEISEAFLNLNTKDAVEVLGPIDSKKVLSCMTLFKQISDVPVFKAVIDKYYEGKEDEMTISLLKEETENENDK